LVLTLSNGEQHFLSVFLVQLRITRIVYLWNKKLLLGLHSGPIGYLMQILLGIGFYMLLWIEICDLLLS